MKESLKLVRTKFVDDFGKNHLTFNECIDKLAQAVRNPLFIRYCLEALWVSKT
jgi:hypothetical protein